MKNTLRYCLISLVACSFALAFAQEDEAQHPVRNAYGRGIAQQHRAVGFAFEVAKHGDRQAGRFRLESGPHSQDRFVLELVELRRLGFGRNTAEFSGPAVLVIQTDHGPLRVEGEVSVAVADWRHGRSSDRTDTLAVRFVGRSHDLQWAFRGGVRQGDIIVR